MALDPGGRETGGDSRETGGRQAGDRWETGGDGWDTPKVTPVTIDPSRGVDGG